MRIDQLGRPAAQAGARVRRRQDGFVVSEDAAPQASVQTAPLRAATDIAAIVDAAGLTAASSAQLDREAAQHGEVMLNTLTKLQLAALGPGGEDARASLADLMGNLKQAADPGLNAVLQGIAARAAVEVARSR